MTDHTEELLPCPFCGTSDLLGFEPSHEGGWTVVKCRKCGCSGSTGLSTSEAEAVAYWNRRATPAQEVRQEAVAIHQWEFGLSWVDGDEQEIAAAKADGCLTRTLYTTPQPGPDVRALVEAVELHIATISDRLADNEAIRTSRISMSKALDRYRQAQLGEQHEIQEG